MWSTDTGRKLADAAFRWALIVGGGLLALAVWALWNVIVTVAPYVVIVAVALWTAGPYLLVFEGFVLGSARQDWREGQLAPESWKHAWWTAHRTVWERFGLRAKWTWTLLSTVVEQCAKTPTLDDLNVEKPRVPLVLLEHNDEHTTAEAA